MAASAAILPQSAGQGIWWGLSGVAIIDWTPSFFARAW